MSGSFNLGLRTSVPYFPRRRPSHKSWEFKIGPVALPLPQAPPIIVAILVEGVASSRLLLEKEIDKFHFEEEQSSRAPLAFRSPRVVRDCAPGPLFMDVGPNPREWVESCCCLSK